MTSSLLAAETGDAIIKLKQHEREFNVQYQVLEKYDELTKMILETESMDDNERQYWFDILPIMTDNQIDRLYKILDGERKKLQELEKKYYKEIKALNEKHLKEYQKMQYDKKFQFLENMRKKENNLNEMNTDELLDSL